VQPGEVSQPEAVKPAGEVAPTGEVAQQPDEGAKQGETAAPAGVPEPARAEPVDVIYGVIARPHETLKALAEKPRPWLGILAYALVTLVSGSQSVLQLRQLGVAATRSIGGIVFATLLSGLAAWFMAVGVMHLAGEVLGGKGSVLGLITVLGVATIPGALLVPLRVAARLTGLTFVSALGSLAIVIWMLLLQVSAVKHNYRVTTGKAVAIFLAPFALMVAVVVGFILMFGVLLLNSPLLRGLPRLPGVP
jgi:hypothetical protein